MSKHASVTQKIGTSQIATCIIPRRLELQTQILFLWLANILSCDMTLPHLQPGEVLMRYGD